MPANPTPATCVISRCPIVTLLGPGAPYMRILIEHFEHIIRSNRETHPAIA